MRFFHLSDLHIGRQLHFYSLEQEQREMFGEILAQARKLRPDAVLIAGDIYDRSVPSAEACTLLDEFLKEFSEIEPQIPLLMIAGNHDNAARLQYAASFLRKNQIYISVLPPASPDEYLQQVVLNDAYGEVHFYLLPFTKPGYVRPLFEEGEAPADCHTAVSRLLGRERIDTAKRNVLLSHQFYTAGDKMPMTCDSEQAYVSVGGLERVDVSAVSMFDYAALGHIHGAQKVGEERFRYCGTPLKYSVSEAGHEKSITLVTLGEKGTAPEIATIPLAAGRDVRRDSGTLAELLARAKEPQCHDYVSLTVTDGQGLYRPKEQLEEVYDHLLEMRVESHKMRELFTGEEEAEKPLDPLEAFGAFFWDMQGRALYPEEREVMARLLADAQKEDV